jgi:hypothetical protein
MVEVLCLWSLLAGNAGIWRNQVSEFQSGYLTMIPVGAYLKLPQQDIDVNGSDVRAGRTWAGDPHRSPPGTLAPSGAFAIGASAIFL